MENIFEDAKFGDIFVNVDGKEMKFVMSDENRARLLEDDKVTGRQYLWTYNLDGANLSGEVEILHKADAPERQLMTEEYLLNKGFTKIFNDLLNIEDFVSPNKQIAAWRNYTIRQHPYDWYVHVGNQDLDTIGSLDFAYVDEFESFLKLCGADYEKYF